MASSWEKRIYSKELEFVGRYSLIYYQKKIEGDACALVAIGFSAIFSIGYSHQFSPGIHLSLLFFIFSPAGTTH
ncbi:hypothetical protein PRUPE_4G279300 [Prunus persica]|uniref:Uncharacterized protein n=1 Tax=Prunus persica TaxID=3760 RepID=A0A251PS35_PRUPE|nr:hypothetical protein PRUPE_4G279300 [Prunus persica]